MMYKNNFDCSSTGINIECCACYDTELSRLYYDDNFYIKPEYGIESKTDDNLRHVIFSPKCNVIKF